MDQCEKSAIQYRKCKKCEQPLKIIIYWQLTNFFVQIRPSYWILLILIFTLIPTLGADFLYLLLAPPFSHQQIVPSKLDQLCYSGIHLLKSLPTVNILQVECLSAYMHILFFSSSDSFFYLSVIVLYIAVFAANRWPFPYKQSHIGPTFILRILYLFQY